MQSPQQPDEAPQAEPQWYDSVWLAKYVEAKEVVARIAPERLDEFVRSFDILRVPADFSQRFVPGFLPPALLEQIRQEAREIPRQWLQHEEVEEFGRFVVRDWPAFTALHVELVDRVSELAGEPLEASYNFLSLYTKMGVCEPHLDAPSAKWTLDVCIDQSDEWPIYFSQVVPWPERREDIRRIDLAAIKSDPSLSFREEVLTPGDAVLFSGTNQWHYRDPLPRKQGGRAYSDLLFFHFIPRGSYRLIQPKEWAEIFAIPALAEIPGIALPY